MNDMYPFKTDDGEIVYVTFEEMMNCDGAGFLTLKDGRLSRRARFLESNFVEKKSSRIELRPQCVSDSLGFTKTQLPQFQDHLEKSGCRGVEFREDPDVPGFMQVVCDSQAAKLAYAKTRGMTDQNSKNGGSMTLTEYDLKNARELALRATKSVD